MTAALLIIDVQKDILKGCGTPERQPVLDAALDAVVARLRNLQDRARAACVPVLMVQHDGLPEERLAQGGRGWEIRDELAPRAGEPVIHKTACDSFYGTDLEQRLRERGVTRLVVGGCMTQYCVDTTVRRAVTLGYDVTLVSDGHTTSDFGELSFDQVIAHHNAVLDWFDAGDKLVRVTPAREVVFQQASGPGA